jgi:hypothetical protein
MALFDAVGFDILAYQELFAPGETPEDRFSVPGAWAKRLPGRAGLVLRRRG